MRGELMTTRNEVSSVTVARTFKACASPEVAERCHCDLRPRDTAHGELHDGPSSLRRIVAAFRLENRS